MRSAQTGRCARALALTTGNLAGQLATFPEGCWLARMRQVARGAGTDLTGHTAKPVRRLPSPRRASKPAANLYQTNCPERVGASYLLGFLSLPETQEWIRGQATRTAMSSIKTESLKDFDRHLSANRGTTPDRCAIPRYRCANLRASADGRGGCRRGPRQSWRAPGRRITVPPTKLRRKLGTSLVQSRHGQIMRLIRVFVLSRWMLPSIAGRSGGTVFLSIVTGGRSCE